MRAEDTPRMTGGVSLRRGVFALWCFVAVSCAQVTNPPTESASATVAPAAAATEPPTVDDAASAKSPSFPAIVAEVTDSIDNPIDGPPVATASEPASPTVSAEDIAPEAAEPVVLAPAATATEVGEPAPGLIAATVASASSAETLDFASLVARLRKTKAMSLRTKVAVKNESNDLLDQFRAYHEQHGVIRLADLRSSYDSLFHKLHSLLEDADPPLARDIDRSRSAIWEVLADPRKFSASVMGGA